MADDDNAPLRDTDLRDTFFDDFFASLAAVVLFALAVAAAAAFLGPAARPPHGPVWSLMLVWAAARAATAVAAATGLPSPCFQLAEGIALRNAASRAALSGLFGFGASAAGEAAAAAAAGDDLQTERSARLAEGVRSAAASLIFVYGGLEIDPEVLVGTGEPAKLLASSCCEAAAVAAAAWWLFSMHPALSCALGAVVKGAAPSLVVALTADVARRDNGGGGGSVTTPVVTPPAAAGAASRRSSSASHTQQQQQQQQPHHQQTQHQHQHSGGGRARRTRLLKLLVGTAPLDEATSLLLFSALAGIALPAGGGAKASSSAAAASSSSSSSSASSWAVPPWAGGLVTLSLALAGSLAGALVLSATKVWSSPTLLAAAAGCVAAAVKGCLALFGHQAAGDLAVIGCGVLARQCWKRGFPWPLAAVSVSSSSREEEEGEGEGGGGKGGRRRRRIVLPLVSAAAVSRARAKLASVWFNVAAPAMLGLAGASVDLRQLDKRMASLAAGVVG